jgi:3-(3-hydroxy-phenyl)propionate hydroxylase
MDDHIREGCEVNCSEPGGPEPLWDVVVVGAGPVGLLCGVLLGAYGRRTLVVERNIGPMTIPRAISMDNDALRALQAADVLDRLREQMPAVPLWQLISSSVGDLMQVEFGGVADGHPKLVAFSQPTLEKTLRAAFQEHDCTELREGVECIDLQAGTEMVQLDCRQRDGTITQLRARYVIGADGANSFVRKSLGLGFDGYTYQEDWLIVDVASAPGRHLEHVRMLSDPRRPYVHVPGPDGAQRWEFMLMPGETREQMERPETIRALIAPWGDISQMQVLRTAVYRFHARTAERIRVGRILLAGDAAHITPPFAGQGLCAGLRDALNLCWKLNWVLRGWADESILDSYHDERLPHVRRMIGFAVYIGRLLMPTNRLLAASRDLLLRAMRAIAPIRRALDTMRSKPAAAFGTGLFLEGMELHSRLRPGATLAQGIVRGGDGALLWGDDALGDSLSLVGFGLDPQTVLSAETLEAWRGVGGICVFLRGRQQNLANHGSPRSRVLEDETGAYVGEHAPVGTIAVVRPDRVVMGVAPRERAQQLVAATIGLLRPVGA